MKWLIASEELLRKYAELLDQSLISTGLYIFKSNRVNADWTLVLSILNLDPLLIRSVLLCQVLVESRAVHLKQLQLLLGRGLHQHLHRMFPSNNNPSHLMCLQLLHLKLNKIRSTIISSITYSRWVREWVKPSRHLEVANLLILFKTSYKWHNRFWVV